MFSVRILPRAAVAGAAAALVLGLAPASALGVTPTAARTAKPVITSIEPARGSSVGYAHLIIRGRHLTGGTVTVGGRRSYARVITSKVIAAFPAGRRHGTRVTVVVHTEAGRSVPSHYEYRHVRLPGRLRATAAAAPPGGTAAALIYTVTRCAAVGTCVSLGDDDGPVARITTRGRTVTRRIPVPADAAADGTAVLTDVACPSVTFCAAVGSYDASSAGLVSTWDGRTWTSRRTPTPVGGDPLHDLAHVSCGAPGHCVAIDDENVYVLDRGTLTAARAPAPAGFRDVGVARVSCPAAGWCSIVGSGDMGTSDRNFVAVRHGTAWTTRVLPDPRSSPGRSVPDLDGFDCVYADRCTVLAGGLAGGRPAPLYFGTLHAGAAHWVAVRSPADARSRTAWVSGEFIDASLHCPSSRTCWALSGYSVRGLAGRRGYQPVALRLRDGAAADVVPMPRPASSRTGWFELDDLSCPTTRSCVAVGSRGDDDVDDIHGDAIVETYSAGVWTPVAAPSPSGRPKYSGYEFTSISCTGVGRCSAVGDYNYAHDPDAGQDEPLEKLRPVVLHIAPR